ncbi:MAG TPA: hypothetical protein VI094_09530 [Propionibacteriaceae bacterium]
MRTAVRPRTSASAIKMRAAAQAAAPVIAQALLTWEPGDRG